jgi:GNAT superfamily N-acetyltransferase
MATNYRRAIQADLERAGSLVLDSINTLRTRHGYGTMKPLRAHEFADHCLSIDPEGLWVAEEKDKIIGFAFSWARRNFWFLAQLFVDPTQQANGVGRVLLQKMLQHARDRNAEQGALITLAYNPVSVGLYIHHEIYPRELLYRASGQTGKIIERIKDSTCQCVSMTDDATSIDVAGEIDEIIIGFRRDEDHRFLGAKNLAKGIVVKREGQPLGYAYFSEHGQVGPLAAVPDADITEVATAALLQCAATYQPPQLSMIIPCNEQLMGAVGKLGMRLSEPLLLMTDRSFGKWQNYMPRDPGYM